jgi:hypothetical protein
MNKEDYDDLMDGISNLTDGKRIKDRNWYGLFSDIELSCKKKNPLAGVLQLTQD